MISAEAKQTLIERAVEHREADRLKQGTYWNEVFPGAWMGCAVGCLATPLENHKHTFEDEEEVHDALASFGVPSLLVTIADEIFEALHYEEAVDWPELFARSLPVGADWSSAAMIGRLGEFFTAWRDLQWALPDLEDDPGYGERYGLMTGFIWRLCGWLESLEVEPDPEPCDEQGRVHSSAVGRTVVVG